MKQRPKLLLGVWRGDYRNWGSMFDFLTSALSMCLAPVPCPLGSSSTASPTSIHSKPGGCVAGKDYGLASVPHANSHWVSTVATSVAEAWRRTWDGCMWKAEILISWKIDFVPSRLWNQEEGMIKTVDVRKCAFMFRIKEMVPERLWHVLGNVWFFLFDSCWFHT